MSPHTVSVLPGLLQCPPWSALHLSFGSSDPTLTCPSLYIGHRVCGLCVPSLPLPPLLIFHCRGSWVLGLSLPPPRALPKAPSGPQPKTASLCTDSSTGLQACGVRILLEASTWMMHQHEFHVAKTDLLTPPGPLLPPMLPTCVGGSIVQSVAQLNIRPSPSTFPSPTQPRRSCPKSCSVPFCPLCPLHLGAAPASRLHRPPWAPLCPCKAGQPLGVFALRTLCAQGAPPWL